VSPHAAARRFFHAENQDPQPVTQLATAVEVNLEGDCDTTPDCQAFAGRFHDQLGVPHYSTGCSLLAVPASLEEWRAEHRTARKRADRAVRKGYRFAHVDFSQHSDDIFQINTSLAVRQGRPMTAGYSVRGPRSPLPVQPCARHKTFTYGVLRCDVLFAYLTLHRAGDLAMVSMILGHGDHLENDVMWLLFAGVVADQAGQGGWFYYNLHNSGMDGLRYFKERQGFRPSDIEWVMQ
jgi:hypothetical protein